MKKIVDANPDRWQSSGQARIRLWDFCRTADERVCSVRDPHHKPEAALRFLHLLRSSGVNARLRHASGEMWSAEDPESQHNGCILAGAALGGFLCYRPRLLVSAHALPFESSIGVLSLDHISCLCYFITPHQTEEQSFASPGLQSENSKMLHVQRKLFR